MAKKEELPSVAWLTDTSNAMSRQRRFEGRILDRVFKEFGILRQTRNRLLKSQTDSGTGFTSEWFNERAGFPFKVWCHTYTDKSILNEIKAMFKPRKTKYSTLINEMDELLAAYPGEPVAFLTRFNFWGVDLVFHTEVDFGLSAPVNPNKPATFFITECSGCRCILQPFEDWLVLMAEPSSGYYWQPEF